jgi:transmembrane sensor
VTNRPPERSSALPQADAQACAWDARLRSPRCTALDRDAFTAWREADPRHAEAFDRLESGLSALHSLYRSNAELRAFRDQALAQRPAYQRSLIAAGVAVALMVGEAGGLWAWRTSRLAEPRSSAVAAGAVSVFQTALGQHSTIKLSDGSSVILDSKSRIEVLFTLHDRHLKLLAGRARFDVARDEHRPFTVDAGGRRIVAVGTAFDVLVTPGGSQVTMLHGKVHTMRLDHALLPAAGPDLAAGQQLVFSANGGDTVRQVKVGAGDDWTSGRILFKDAPLAEVITEVNLYTDKPIVLADPSLVSEQVGGMFMTTAPDQFVDALAAYFSLRVQADPDATVLSRRRE